MKTLQGRMLTPRAYRSYDHEETLMEDDSLGIDIDTRSQDELLGVKTGGSHPKTPGEFGGPGYTRDLRGSAEGWKLMPRAYHSYDHGANMGVEVSCFS